MTTLSDDERRAIEHDCQKIMLATMNLNDARRYEEMAAHFAEDAVFIRPTNPDEPISGRDAILASFRARPANRVGRHICTNVVIDVQSADRAVGRMYALLVTGDTANPADNPVFGVVADHKKFIGEITDNFVKTADGWRIAKREGRLSLSIE